MRTKFLIAMTLASAVCVACGGGGGGGGNTGVTPVPTGTPLPLIVRLALTSPLVMASPGSSTHVEILDQNGNPLRGTFSPPITFHDLDTTGHTSFSGTATITSPSQWPALNYDGHADRFSIDVTIGTQTSTPQTFLTMLPKEHVLPSSAPQFFGQPIVGPDGNFWLGYGTAVYKVTTNSQITQYVNPGGNVAYQGGAAMAVGSDGNLWVAGRDGFHETGAISRVTLSGQFTDYTFPTALNVVASLTNEMTLGPDGRVWFSATNQIWAIDTSGTITHVGDVTNTPSNLTKGPDGNLWFVDGSNIGKMTPAGTVTEYPLPGASSGPVLHFVFGPDGNLWIPFPFNQQELMKVSTSGAVVSTTPLLYTAPWDPFNTGPNEPYEPSFIRIAIDTTHHLYMTDVTTQAVLRMDDSGHLDAYPTYSTLTNITDDALSITRGADGNFYLSSMAILGLTQAQNVQAFTPIDQSLW